MDDKEQAQLAAARVVCVWPAFGYHEAGGGTYLRVRIANHSQLMIWDLKAHGWLLGGPAGNQHRLHELPLALNAALSKPEEQVARDCCYTPDSDLRVLVPGSEVELLYEVGMPMAPINVQVLQIALSFANVDGRWWRDATNEPVLARLGADPRDLPARAFELPFHVPVVSHAAAHTTTSVR